MTAVTAGSLPKRPPANPQGAIAIEIDIADRARAAFAASNMLGPAAEGERLIFSYAVLADCISDPVYTYNREQLQAVMRGLDRARRQAGDL